MHAPAPRRRPFVFLPAAVALTVTLAAAPAAAQAPTLSMAFLPDTVGVGSSSQLQFTVDHAGAAAPATDVAFDLTLPSGLLLAAPLRDSTSCTDAAVAALAGGTAVDVSGGRIGTGVTCIVVVDVIGATAGVHVATTSDITSSLGSGSPATASLTVDTARPGFTKAFSPASVPFGGTTTLTFSIDHTTGAAIAFGLDFLDSFPAGMVVATPDNAGSDCSAGGPAPSVAAVPGADSIAVTGGAVANGNICSVWVDVTASQVGTIGNTSGTLNSSVGNGGRASAVLDVTIASLNLSGFFVGDPVAPGGSIDLEYTITNFSRDEAATDVSFSDDLDAALSGLVATGLPATDVCGPGSQLSGTSSLSLTGGSLPAGGQCAFTVALQVPAGAIAGSYTHTSSAVSATVGGTAVTGSAATDFFTVGNGPAVRAVFTDDPVAAGGDATLEWTIDNLDATAALADLTFATRLDAVQPGIVVAALPMSDICGAGSTLLLNPSLPPVGSQHLQLVDGSLAAGANCTYSATLTLPPTMAGGTYASDPGSVSATIAATTVTGTTEGDALTVVTAPELRMSFVDGPALPGDTTTLEIALTSGENAPADVTDVAFTVDLDAALTGLAATGLPLAGPCGGTIDGTSLLTFAAGALAPHSTCTIDVPIRLPAGAAAGQHPLSSSDVTGNSLGVAVRRPGTTQNLEVAGLLLSKSFIDDPVAPGGVVTIEYTLDNQHPTASATDIVFADDVDAAIAGATAVGLSANPVCGVGSSLSGTSLIVLSGGALSPASSCSFQVDLQIPPTTPPGEYPSGTEPMSATVGAVPMVLPGARDTLFVSDRLLLTKRFTDDPVLPGEVATLEFTLVNGDASFAATNVEFTDALQTALPGLTALGTPRMDLCGAGSQLSGSTILTFAGGTLAPASICSFTVSVQLPLGIAVGTTATNVTGQATATIDGMQVTAVPAVDDLLIDVIDFSKAFDAPAILGGEATLTFTLHNPSPSFSVDGLTFTDDLDASLPGLTAVQLPADGACGASSVVAGSSAITFGGGSIAAGDSCSFSVTLQVPASATVGSYANVTSPLSAAGQHAASPATATFVVRYPPPTFGKAFAPASIVAGERSLLTFTIDNTSSPIDADTIAFDDPLPAGLLIDADPEAATTCSDGLLDAAAGGTSIALSGARLPGGESCDVRLYTTSATPGTYDNVTGALTSSEGDSGIATASLAVTAAPEPPGGGSQPDDGCGCGGSSASPTASLGLLLLAWVRRRRSPRQTPP